MLVYGQDERVTAWIARQLGYPESYPSSAAIGYERDGELVAAVCFDNASTTNVFAHIASTATLLPVALLSAVAAYAFVQLKVKRMTFMLYDTNRSCVRLVESLGAKHEATLADGHAGGDTLIYALWPDSRFFKRLTESGRITEASE